MADAPERPCETRRRWFRPTPGWFVLGLLAVEVLLLLSERFEWFAFNRHKGYTVLIAVATAGVTFLLMFLWFLAAVVFRRRFQFSVLSLLGLTVVVALICGWFFPEREQAKIQREAVAAIRALGGTITYDYEADHRARYLAHQTGEGPRVPPGPPSAACTATVAPAWPSVPPGPPSATFTFPVVPAPPPPPVPPAPPTPPGPAWARRLLGKEFFADVVEVGYPIPWMSSGFFEKNPITDAWLEHIGKLTRLKELDLENSRVSDACLVRLQGLTRLRTLNLAGTWVMDSGLCVVRKLTRLEVLDLSSTRVSDLGLESLEGLTHLRELDLSSTQVTDDGLAELAGLRDLRLLNLSATRVTAGGVSRLQRSLPECAHCHPLDERSGAPGERSFRPRLGRARGEG